MRWTPFGSGEEIVGLLEWMIASVVVVIFTSCRWTREAAAAWAAVKLAR